MAHKVGGEVLIRMDEGSAGAIGLLVEEGVGCGNTMNLQTENGFFDYLRHGLFCKAMFAGLEEHSPQSEAQCVVMGGSVEGCPRFGMTPTGEPRGEHERLAKLSELQKYVAKHINYHPLGNFSVFNKE